MPRFVAQNYEETRLRKIAKWTSGNSILDIGYAQMPNQYLDASICTGLDLKIAKDCNYKNQIIGNAMDVKDLFDEHKFDTIVASEFIEHLEKPYEFLRNLHYVIQPNGRLILSTPNPVSFPVLWFELINSRKYFYTENHTYYFTPRWVQRLIENSGYRLLKSEPVGLWPFGRIFAPLTISYQVIYIAEPIPENR